LVPAKNKKSQKNFSAGLLSHRGFGLGNIPFLGRHRRLRYASIMTTTPDTISLIGNTPLVRLKGPSEESGCEIYGKCEFANPGASVKDRAALYIVRDAEEKGQLKPGGIIVEGTAGNTGIGLALVANARGYKTIIVMPETQSKEKMDTLRALGAELVLVPAAPYSNPGHFVHTSRRIAEETPGAIWANQFDNIANRKAHIMGTAEEIWAQMDGRIDGFTCAAGTGGTIAGVGLGLKAKDEKVTIALSDPFGAALYNYYAHGELKAEGSSVAEGIGQGRITGNLDGAPIDTQFRISDEEGLLWVRRLLAEEGLCLGLSSGINVAGAIALGKQLGPGSRIVTILCDTGFRYLSTLYNADWLVAKGLTVFPWLMHKEPAEA
jgi:cysteine synthase A